MPRELASDRATVPGTFYEVNLCITWKQYPKCDVCSSDSLQDIRKNHLPTYMFLVLGQCVTLNQ